MQDSIKHVPLRKKSRLPLAMRTRITSSVIRINDLVLSTCIQVVPVREKSLEEKEALLASSAEAAAPLDRVGHAIMSTKIKSRAVWKGWHLNKERGRRFPWKRTD
jgi:hypothetical protein